MRLAAESYRFCDRRTREGIDTILCSETLKRHRALKIFRKISLLHIRKL